jgi:hypothetical protein
MLVLTLAAVYAGPGWRRIERAPASEPAVRSARIVETLLGSFFGHRMADGACCASDARNLSGYLSLKRDEAPEK